MNQKYAILGILLMSMFMITTATTTNVAQASSGGASDGESDARQDFLDSAGTDKDGGCSPYEHTDGYCTAYKIAYGIQWAYMSVQYDCSSGECR